VIKTLSFAVRTSCAPQEGAAQLRIMRIDRLEEVHLRTSSFLVRVAVDPRRRMERCTIRHVASGREAYVQGGPGLSAFVQTCLFENLGAHKEQDDGEKRPEADN
jgi:hypothetical protein